MERKTVGFPCVFVKHGAADSLGSVTFVGFRLSSATQQEVFVPTTCQSSSSNTILFMFVCGWSVHVCGYRSLVTNLLPGTWQGKKNVTLKLLLSLCGGVIMFVSLLLPTRWGEKKHQGSETDTEKANMTLHIEEQKRTFTSPPLPALFSASH